MSEDNRLGYLYNDGGRAAAGYRGSTGDCVTRSIAIATGLPYQEVYDSINELAVDERLGKRHKKRSSSRTGVWKGTYRPYLESLGWHWHATMRIGSGCKVHLRADELPMGRLIVRLSKHLTAVIDGCIHDTFDPTEQEWMRSGPDGVAIPIPRCVYGYFSQEQR